MAFLNDKWFTNFLLSIIAGIIMIVSPIAIHTWNKMSDTLAQVVNDGSIVKEQVTRLRVDVDMLIKTHYEKKQNSGYEKAESDRADNYGNTSLFSNYQKAWCDTNSSWYCINYASGLYTAYRPGYSWQLLGAGGNDHYRNSINGYY